MADRLLIIVPGQKLNQAWYLFIFISIQRNYMGIDYYGCFPCKVREAVSDADLLRMEKARNRALSVLEIMRNNPQTDNKSKPESDWSFKMVVLGPDGPEETEMRIADLLLEAAPLEQLAHHCSGCPANIRSVDFGCGGAIHYPISAQAERWLLSRLPSDLNSPRGFLLKQAIADFNFDGLAIDTVRNRQDLYESSKPEERKWGSFFSKKTRITSSQILHMAFCVGSLQAQHAKLVAYFLGFLDDDFSIANDSANLPQPGDDDRTIELKSFFAVASLAGVNEVSVFIDA
ncbi:hypothetical protein HA050_14665 [Iodobacter sp. HSC-16F04]|uniref:Uncharacterized protein n=1 Tax=Iodobacter violaceini TaxID=3044271 RepID=A0ABX0KRV2_9NEIS|nr:hypothetical protein [Iodobacter violacea]NHQ87356.1 hypothetical protein [Iodobacter violacea]